MSAHAIPARPARVPGRSLAGLSALTVVLAAAFVLAPRVLAGIGPFDGFSGQGDLVANLRASFVGYWSSGDRELSPGMQEVVDYWFRYHLAKAAIAALLLVVLAGLGTLVWRAFLNTEARGRGRKTALASAGTLVTGLAAFALIVLMANLQGMAAPYASLLPLLTAGATGDRLTGSLEEIRAQLASPDGATSPAVDAMISDFAWYHAAIAVIAAVTAVALIALSGYLWKRFRGTPRTAARARRVLASLGAFTTLLSLALIFLAAVNTATAADPAPALLAFFEGGW